MSLYGTHKNIVFRKNHREAKQYRLERHVENHPTDYQSIIANEKLKSEIFYLEYRLKQVLKEMEIDGEEY
jgi:hypothetical protein|nr:MAG TPA: hypothetical protein [Caudoviricetes sp.]